MANPANKPSGLIGDIQEVPIEAVDPNPHQARTTMHEPDLERLRASIESDGMLAPILIRPGADGRYILVAGQRRLEAHRRLGRETISAIVTDAADPELLTIVENVVRENLSAVDLARGLKLLEERGLDQGRVGAVVGMGRSDVAKTMKILSLPKRILAEYERNPKVTVPDSEGAEPRTVQEMVSRSALVELAAAHAALQKSFDLTPEEADAEIGEMWDRAKSTGLTRAEIREVKTGGPAAGREGGEERSARRTKAQKARAALDGDLAKLADTVERISGRFLDLKDPDTVVLAEAMRGIYGTLTRRKFGDNVACDKAGDCDDAPICEYAEPSPDKGEKARKIYAVSQIARNAKYLEEIVDLASDDINFNRVAWAYTRLMHVLACCPTGMPSNVCEYAVDCEYLTCLNAFPHYKRSPEMCMRPDTVSEPVSISVTGEWVPPFPSKPDDRTVVVRKMTATDLTLRSLQDSDYPLDDFGDGLLEIRSLVDELLKNRVTGEPSICEIAGSCDRAGFCVNGKATYNWNAGACLRFLELRSFPRSVDAKM